MDFLKEALELFDYTRALRRDFHMHPELGFREVRTAGIVSRELHSLGLEVTTGVAETGVVAMIEGGPGPVVLLRFDMDALPIQEETGAEYASQTPGVMHACGHDGHTAIGLAVARLLQAHRQELNGSVKLVFQPAEEGMGGAPRMIREGVLENPRPEAALALHVWNDKPLGWVGVAPGPVMATAETFRILVTGKGGHGALPHLAVDPVLAASQIVVGLQSIVARNVSPLQAAVVTVAAIRGGEAFNVIPPVVEMKGTIRTYEPEIRALVLERFQQVVECTAEAYGCQAQVEISFLTPAVVNDPEITAGVQRLVSQVLPEATLDTGERTMGSEDMAYILQEVPGCFMFIGSANAEQRLEAPHHHPRFDFDEQALPRAAALMAAAAVDYLAKPDALPKTVWPTASAR
jgi:amidohydrolase